MRAVRPGKSIQRRQPARLSNAEAKARYMREVEGRAGIDPRALMMDRQLGMTEQQVQHLTRFAGV
jgi:hypothetical protein